MIGYGLADAIDAAAKSPAMSERGGFANNLP